MRVSICKGSYWIKGILVLIFVEGYRIIYLVVKHIYHAGMILFLQKSCLESYMAIAVAFWI